MKNKMTTIAVLSVAFLSLIRGTLGPGMSLLYEYYHDYSPSFVSMVITLPSLAVIPASYVFGKITGVYIKYKTAAILTNLFLLIGGAGPYLSDNIYLLMALRFLFGIGVGTAITIHKPMILEFFSLDKQNKYLGYTTVISSVGMIFFQSLVGLLAQNHRDSIFLAYLPILVTLILSFFIPDIQCHRMTDHPKITGGYHLEKRLSAIIVIYLLINLTATCFGINQTVMLASKGIKNVAVTAAVLGNVQSVFSMLSGLTFGKLDKCFKSQLIYMALFGCIIALGFIAVSQSFVLIIMAMALFGFTYNIIILYIFIIACRFVSKERIALAGGYMGIAAGIGGFLATGLMELSFWLTGEAVYTVIGLFIVLLVVMLVIMKILESR